ncbi:MAG: signal transduction histidine kinase [Crocinitomix sp.]
MKKSLISIMRFLSTIILFTSFCINASAQTSDLLIYEATLKAPLDAESFELDGILDMFHAYLKVGSRSEQDSVYQIFNENRNLIDSQQDSAYSFYCLGYLELKKSNYLEARFYLNKAGILFDKTGDELGALYTKYLMANLNYFMKRIPEAFDQYHEILQNPNRDYALTATMHHNIACLMLELEHEEYGSDDEKKSQKKLNEIAGHFDESLRLNKILKNEKEMAGTYSVYLNVKIHQNDFAGAQMVIDSSEAIALRNNDIGRQAFLNIKKAMLYDTLGYHQMAIDTAYKAAEYYNSIENFVQEIHALTYVYRANYKLERFQEAANAIFKINQLGQKRLDKELTTSLAKFEAEFETEKKSLELERKQAQLEKEKLSNYNKNIIITTIIIIAIALMLVVLLIQQKRKRTLVEKQSKEKIRLKQQSLNSVIQAQENERQRIAKDLHDSIVQQLGSLKIRLSSTFVSQKVSDDFSIELLEKTTSELRELSHRMMPKSLEELGLIAALKDTLSMAFDLTEIEYTFDCFGLEGRLPQKLEITIFRVLQELINNIIKHSQASEVSVQLIKNQSHTIVIVEDNGVGFSIKNEKNGIGLLNINSRLDSVDGSVNFEPSVESGTLVTIRIPNESE